MKKILFILTLLVGFCSCQKEPSRIYIKKITVNAISYSDANGTPWETNGTNPDLFLTIDAGSGFYYSSTQNNVTFSPSPYWDVNSYMSPSQSSTIKLYEAGGTSRLMVEFTFQHPEGSGLQDKVTLSKNGYSIDLALSYDF